MKKSSIIITFAIATLASCNTATQNCEDKSVFRTVNREKTFEFSTEFSEEMHPGEPSFCTNSIFAFIPENINGDNAEALTDSIKSRAFPYDTDSKCFDEAVEKFINNYGYTPEEVKNLKEADSVQYTMRSAHSIDIGIASTGENIISFKIAIADYIEGAAHGYAYNTYVNYATAEKKVISLADLLIIDDYLITNVKQQLITKYGAESYEELKANLGLLVEEKDFKLSGDFLIDGNKITLSYRPYELACFAAGTIELEIYPYTVSENLTELGKKILL